ncbi:hypothetical protein B0J13DRAFT_604530 [Dactylonectria estremocensis]|uniref:Uncharacterized protein n=1 Tax=Dactylonectria estremocensis TaxID=1079267 RepID=A0A9P9F7Y2_9HYPO|nr:hypothetical protein B0J13DRAFT_604530 [Dactylonectria estremocensis]
MHKLVADANTQTLPATSHVGSSPNPTELIRLTKFFHSCNVRNSVFVPYITVTREIDAPIGEVWVIVAAFGAERTWYPGCRKLTLEDFGTGNVRTLDYECPAGKNKGQRYVFSEEMTAVDADKHSMVFRARRPD